MEGVQGLRFGIFGLGFRLQGLDTENAASALRFSLIDRLRQSQKPVPWHSWQFPQKGGPLYRPHHHTIILLIGPQKGILNFGNPEP